ncbi:MAG: hypothetical protein KUL75_08845 [Sterolibacterium sp.]|nr:hypothetical protein [Sterolibacterium sp.]
MTTEQDRARRSYKLPERLKEERLAKVRGKLERAMPSSAKKSITHVRPVFAVLLVIALWVMLQWLQQG